MTQEKFAYLFVPGRVDGDASMRNQLGGKGALLAELARIGCPVPAGFTLTTAACLRYLKEGEAFLQSLRPEVEAALAQVEQATGMQFGGADNPLLLSCRSGARRSMPGMMESVLDLGACPRTIEGMLNKTRNKRFVYDAYRRLIMMYADVVLEKAAGLDPPEGQAIRAQLERIMTGLKMFRMCETDVELIGDDLEQLCHVFLKTVHKVLGQPIPSDPHEQLWNAIVAVFKSWNGKRARAFRRMEGIPDHWGTACTVQQMVFGNMDDNSATGVAFTRNPATGENIFYGEWLPNGQGEDVVSGSRTPWPLNTETLQKGDYTENGHELTTLETAHPEPFQELLSIRSKLEHHFQDMQDIEFTIQQGKLYMLQCRTGKRTTTAAVNMAMDMQAEELVDEETAVSRVPCEHLDELLHPMVDPAVKDQIEPLGEGLPAGPGAATGQIVFSSEEAVRRVAENKHRENEKGVPVILVREETSPEDIEGMQAAAGILTTRGGMVCHAALVARGWGKCCIVGAGKLQVDTGNKRFYAGNQCFAEGDVLTLDGTAGLIYPGSVPLKDGTGHPRFQQFMHMADRHRKLGIRANAETPKDVQEAIDLGAEGVGLFRVEHMFYGRGSEGPLLVLRKVVLSVTEDEREDALRDLFPYFKQSVKATLAITARLPVTIRLFDPPLHEFVPRKDAECEKLARSMNLEIDDVRQRASALHETNPMMGHRGVRLGITFPRIVEVQLRAILEAAAELDADGVSAKPEIMVPFANDPAELLSVKKVLDEIASDTRRRVGQVDYTFGTMIETPRACFVADQLAEIAEFFSFGTNDLTQMTFAFSRDDVDRFMGDYLSQRILHADPFQTIDQLAVGELMRIAVQKGRARRPGLKIGLCGEHGGDPASVKYCTTLGLDYVSCSTPRLPIARLAAAQSAVHDR
ncbi:MAG: pyruvate, phosphate dikinase [Pirellulaceae bacterium]